MKHPVAQMHHPIESYEHMMGTPKKAHEGSQSAHPAPEKGKNAGLKETHGKSLPEKAGGEADGMSYSDE